MVSPCSKEFQEVMNDIYKLTPMISLEDQPLLQLWVRRLAARDDQGESAECALDYARYLAFHLQKSRLQFPFTQPPPEGGLSNLTDVLFRNDRTDDSIREDSPLSPPLVPQLTQNNTTSRDSEYDPYEFTEPVSTGSSTPGASRASWGSHRRIFEQQFLHAFHDDVPNRDTSMRERPRRDSNPIQLRLILTELEDLPADAPLWLLLSRVSPHTRDKGALLYAVVAEELAEWTARLAADQTMANRIAEQDDEDMWGLRADRRADYWSEVWDAWKNLNKEDERAGFELAVEIITWLNQHCRQLQAEHAQLQALFHELQEIQCQVHQSKIWREAQFDAQNRALQTEVLALKDSIAANEREIAVLSGRVNVHSTPQHQSPDSVARKLSYSQDRLNTSSLG